MNNTGKIIGTLCVLVLALLAATYFISKKEAVPVVVAPVVTETMTSQDIVWTFTPVENTEEDLQLLAPKTKVTVHIKNKEYDAGTYTGSCIEKTVADLHTNEISGVRCWFAGAGDEVGVYSNNNTYTIEHYEIGEPTAESPAFRSEGNILISL